MKRLFMMTLVMIAATTVAFGQQPVKGTVTNTSLPKSLYDEIEHMDSLLTEAFNTPSLDKLKALFAEDLEFYQDNEGLAGYAQTMKDFQSMFAQNLKLRRELIKGSLEVYPIKNYGAIEIGSHRFCHIENGKDDCGTFKFVHVWQNKDGAWKIARVISYNH